MTNENDKPVIQNLRYINIELRTYPKISVA